MVSDILPEELIYATNLKERSSIAESTCITLYPFEYAAILELVSSFPSYASGPNASAGISTCFVTVISKPLSLFTLFASIVPLLISNGPLYISHVFPLSRL